MDSFGLLGICLNRLYSRIARSHLGALIAAWALGSWHNEGISLSIFNVTPREVARGELSGLFQKGQAVLLHRDPRVSRLLRSVLDWLGLNTGNARDRHSSFEMNLLDLARNHQEGNFRAGDMLRFVPSLFGHFARKFVVCRSADDQSLKAFPNAFYLQDRRVPVPHDIIEDSWNVMSEVFRSALPKGAHTLAYAVEVDVLVYPPSRAEIEKLHTLLADSAGFWAQLGHRIDANKAAAAGIFDTKVIRDLFSVTSLVPGINYFAQVLNERMLASSEKSVPDDHRIIGNPHVDMKYVTGLAGCRDNVHTQIFCQKRWVPLPVTADTLAVFPGQKMSSFGDTVATRHRVLLQNPTGGERTVKRNITLSLSIVDRPNHAAETDLLGGADCLPVCEQLVAQ